MADTFDQTSTGTDLERRVHAGEIRAERRHRHADSSIAPVADFIAEHPVSTVLGGIALGLLIGTALPSRRIGRRISGLANQAAELGATYALQAWDAAGDAADATGDAIEDLGDAVTDRSRHARRETRFFGGETKDTLRALKRDTGKAAKRTGRDSAKSIHRRKRDLVG